MHLVKGLLNRKGAAAPGDGKQQSGARYYYVHVASGTSQWEEPTAAEPSGPLTSAVAPPARAPGMPSPAHAHNSSSYYYYDPHGKLLGPFSRQQLSAWRAFLPMDLIVLLEHPGSSNGSSINSNQQQDCVPWPAATAGASEGDTSTAADAAGVAADASSSSQRWFHLAQLLGDGQLLESWQQSAGLHPKQQQQQQQPWPPKAKAPPAPIWESWCASYSSSSSAPNSSPAAPTAPAPAAVHAPQQEPGHAHHHQLYPDYHQQHHWQQPAAAALAAAGSSRKASSGFEKYAAAVLQGLPPDDEAVQLAQLAAAQGCSLQEVMQSAAAAAAAGSGAPGAPGGLEPADDRICYEEKPNFGGILLTKDPRSGRLTAVGGSSGSGGSSSSIGPDAGGCSKALAAELYGDLARWIDPSSLEQSLNKASKAKRQQQQGPLPPPPMPPPVAAAAGSGAVGKKMRVRL